MNARIVVVTFAFCAVFVAGCGTTYRYEDPGGPRTSGPGLTVWDFQQCAATMMDSLLKDKRLAKELKERFPKGGNPSVAISLHNRTLQLGATDKLKRSMFDTIEAWLFKSGKFDVIDRGADQTLIDLIVEEINNPLVRRSEAKPFGNGKGIDYVIVGTIIEDRGGDERTIDCYYKMNMKMFSVKARRLVWVEEKEIRKVGDRPLVGW